MTPRQSRSLTPWSRKHSGSFWVSADSHSGRQCVRSVVFFFAVFVLFGMGQTAKADRFPPAGCITEENCPKHCPRDAVVADVRIGGECKGALRRSLFVYPSAPQGFRPFAWEQKRYLDNGTSCRVWVKLQIHDAPVVGKTVRLQETFYSRPTQVIARSRTNRKGWALIKFRWSKSRCRYDLDYWSPYNGEPLVQSDDPKAGLGCDGV